MYIKAEASIVSNQTDERLRKWDTMYCLAPNPYLPISMLIKKTRRYVSHYREIYWDLKQQKANPVVKVHRDTLRFSKHHHQYHKCKLAFHFLK
jgi:hypothetical protein